LLIITAVQFYRVGSAIVAANVVPWFVVDWWVTLWPDGWMGQADHEVSK